MVFRYMPEGQRSQIIFERAAIFAHEEQPSRRKLREREFIDDAVQCIVAPLRSIGEMETPAQHMQAVREFFAEIGEDLSDAPYDGSDPGVAYAWAAEALQFAGVVSEVGCEDFDGEDVVVIPAATFDTVLHGVEDWLRRMAEDLRERETTGKVIVRNDDGGEASFQQYKLAA